MLLLSTIHGPEVVLGILVAILHLDIVSVILVCHTDKRSATAAALLREAGFRNVRILKFEKGVSYYREPNGEAAWTMFSTGYGPTKSLAANLDDARRADLRRDFIAFHDGFPTELGICVPREYWVTIGVRK